GKGRSPKKYAQGWKLHVSVAPDQIAQLLPVCLPLLHDKLEVFHKVVKSVEAYRQMTGDNPGKFITIYPRDVESLVLIVTMLDSALLDCTTSFRGHQRAPHDHPVGSSGMISARYGAFTESTKKVLNPTTDEEADDDRTRPQPERMETPEELVTLIEQARIALQRDRSKLEHSKLEIGGSNSNSTPTISNSNTRRGRDTKLPPSSSMSLSMPDNLIGDRISIDKIDEMLGPACKTVLDCLPDHKAYLFEVFGQVFSNAATLGDANKLTALLMECQRDLPQGFVGKISVLLFNRFRLLGEMKSSGGTPKPNGGHDRDGDRDDKRRHRAHRKDEDEGGKQSRSHGSRSQASSKGESSAGFDGKTSGLRQGSADALEKEGTRRIPLSDQEQAQQGFAVLPILTKWHEHDKANTGRLKQYDAHKRQSCAFHLRGGKLVSFSSNEHLDTTKSKMGYSDMHRAMTDLAEADGVDTEIDQMDGTQFEELQRKATVLGGTQIFVMNAQGEIFAAKEMVDVIHHSTFLAGGAIACAGTIRTSSDGTINFISNKSGHYEPGPAYLWQVLFNMRKHGVDLGGVKIWVLGMKGQFSSAEAFFDAFDPSQESRYFNSEWALAQLETKVTGKK
nr:hypothetical protein [Deltaproteobacteria bacterium]